MATTARCNGCRGIAASGLVLAWLLGAGCADDAGAGDDGMEDGGTPDGGMAGNAGGGATGGSSGEGGAGSGGGGGAAGEGPDAGEPMTDAGMGTDASSDAALDEDEDAGAAVDASTGEPAVRPFTAMEIAMYGTLSPLGEVPADPTNAYADDPDAAALGQQLFFDASYSGALAVASDLGAAGEEGKVSCFSCHSGPYLDDQRSVPSNVSLGANFHSRNAPTTINSAFYTWTNWGGRFSAQWELPLAVAESPVIMNSTRLRIAHRIFDAYRVEYEAVFGAMEPAIGSDAGRFPATGKPNATAPGAWEAMSDPDREVVNRIFVNYGKAIAAYLRLLVSRDSDFDAFVSGDESALSPEAQRGLQLFLGKARCINCHLGPHLSDGEFHDLGVPQSGEHVPASDDGRYKDVPPLLSSPFSSATSWSDDTTTGRLAGLTNPPPERDRGRFRTPSLRGVALTAPYMHSGQLATLEEVIELYDEGGAVPVSGTRDPLLVPLHLTAQEKSDLAEFLRSLTGDPVDSALLVDTSAP